MANLYAITYLSEASRDLLPQELDAILLDARLFNTSVDVTGVLFYGNGCFFQMIEGEEASVRKAFDRLSQASSHHMLRILCEGPIAGRFFESWHMGFVHAPTSAIQQLSQAAWEDAIPYTREDAEKSEGIGLLMYYWNKWAAEPSRSAP